MQLSAVEPVFKRFRFLLPALWPVRMCLLWHKTWPWSSLHSLHWLYLQDTSTFCWFWGDFFVFFLFSWGFPCNSAHAYQLLVSLFSGHSWYVGFENELLGKSAGWSKVEGWLWDFLELPKPQCAGSLGLLFQEENKIQNCLFKQIARQHGSFCFQRLMGFSTSVASVMSFFLTLL